MAHVLLTCLPRDRDQGTAAFIAAQAQQASMITRIDAREYVVPSRFWPPTKALIANPARAEAWLILLTDDALADAEALVVLRHALSGARGTREADFPIIGLRPGSGAMALPDDLMGLTQVSLTDGNWPETVRAKIERRQPRRSSGATQVGAAAYTICLHARSCRQADGDQSPCLALELRPGQAAWAPFFVGLPASEAAAVSPIVRPDIRGAFSWDDATQLTGWSMDGAWQVAASDEPANRRTSYYMMCSRLPSVIRFGVPGGHLQYTARLRPVAD